MSEKFPGGFITPTPPYASGNFSGVWTLDQLAQDYYYYKQAVSNSLRFRASASAYLNRTPASAGNQQTWTWSGWVKRGTLGARQQMFCQGDQTTTYPSTIIEFASSDKLSIVAYSGSFGMQLETTAVYRDPSSWYHIVVAVDTTQGSSTDRVKAYVNGVQVTSFSTATYPSQNYLTGANATVAANIGRDTSGALYLDGYLSEINLIDGQALDPSYFGQVSPITGVWSPAKYVGSYGTNGFYLNFINGTSTTTLGYDASGNGNNWTTNNISLTAGSTYDWMLDSPTNYANGGNGVGNYAVLNPLDSASMSLSSANLNVTFSSGSGWNTTRATIYASSGKWYWEITAGTISSGNPIRIGITQSALSPTSYLAADATSFCYANTGEKITNNSALSYGSSYVGSDVIGVALDLDAGTLTFYKNGVSQGQAYSGISGSYAAAFSLYVGQTSSATIANFGQRPFAYTPPTGFNALNTQNLPAASIVNGASFMAATLYTGNGATQSIVNAVNGTSFQPDFVWVKNRTNAAGNMLLDSVRGTDANGYLVLESDGTAGESTFDTTWHNNYGKLTALNSNGFTVVNGSTTGNFNTGSNNYVGWQWKAGGTAVTNTAGSITSQVSANTTAGFSVVTYTGTGASAATIGHGLGVAPNFVFLKQRNGSTYGWIAYHSALGAGSYLVLNQTFAGTADTAMFNNTAPTSSVFTLSSGGDIVITNPSGGTMVAYCFAAISGYSAFGSYTGNGSTSGPFVYCGFRPRYVLVKASSTTGDWCVLDTSRSPYNLSAAELYPNLSNAEGTGTNFEADIVSNGFVLRGTGADSNGSGTTYIYACFAENPLKYSLAR